LTFSCNFLPDRIDTYSYIMEIRWKKYLILYTLKKF
jgi:hypothetical protein